MKSDREQLLGDGLAMKQEAEAIGACHPGQSEDILRDNSPTRSAA